MEVRLFSFHVTIFLGISFSGILRIFGAWAESTGCHPCMAGWFGGKMLPPRGEGEGQKPEYVEKSPDGQPCKQASSSVPRLGVNPGPLCSGDK